MSEEKKKGPTLAVLGSMFAKWAKWDIWWFDAADWLGFLNRLKKHEIQGLLTGTYVLLERIKYHSPTFKSLTVGGANGVLELIEDLQQTSWKIDGASREVVQTCIGVEHEIREIDLVLASKKDLGLRHNASIEQVFARAEELGLECCPDETGLRICRIHFYPSDGRTLVVASRGILDPQTRKSAVLLVTCYHMEPMLKHGPGNKNHKGYQFDEFVFVRPRPSK